MVKIAVDKRAMKIYVKEEIYETELSGTELEAKIRSKIEKERDLIVCDTNEPRTTNDLRKSRVNIQEARKNEIKDDLRAMADYQLIVHPDSNNYKKELNNYIWNDKKASIPVDAWNHLIDPTRYGFVRLVKQSNSSGSTKTKYGRR
jgi:phage terminase large subunit